MAAASLMHNKLVKLIVFIGTAIVVVSAGRRQNSYCSNVKQSFQSDKPDVASTILDSPAYDGSLVLCKFTNHSESQRVSCCSHDTERELLEAASVEYTTMLVQQTDEVKAQLTPGAGLKHHYERMLSISKRMTEYELGSTLYLHHARGRELFDGFYKTLSDILISYDRSTSVFMASDKLLDELFVYIVRESKFPSSRADPDPKYYECLKQNRRALTPSPFPVKLENLAISLHYSAVAASYLSESMDVVFQALKLTKEYNVSSHCLRDMTKMNHCQKCYGYTQLKPCRDFCEDVYLVCLQELMRLDTNWEYHRKIIKILAEYILKRVDLQVLLNTFHTELKANIDLAILQYSSYRKQLEAFCGPPKFLNSMSRLKVWEKPAVTTYDGAFSADLRQLVVNLELKITGFYTNLYSVICSSEPDSTGSCWDGLTERVNKKKNILEFSDLFAPYPETNEDISELILTIKRIRSEVLKIFLKRQGGGDKDKDKQNGAGDDLEGSGSGDEPGMDPDSEPGNAVETVEDEIQTLPTRADQRVTQQADNKHTVTQSIPGEKYSVHDPDEDSIELLNDDKTPRNKNNNNIKTTQSTANVGSLNNAGLPATRQSRLSDYILLVALILLNIHLSYH